MVELVDNYRGQVFGLCYRMLRHRQDAEDVTQESFVRVLRSLRTWDQQREFLPWLLAIAGNRCRTLLAVRMRQPAVTSLVDHLSDKAVEITEARNLAEEVDRALSMLRAEYRQAFLLFHQHELSYAQIQRHARLPLGDGQDVGSSRKARADRAIKKSWSRSGVAACSAKSLKIV